MAHQTSLAGANKRTAVPVFDYESKTWGGHQVGLSPRHLGALKLRYCLEDLSEIEGSVLEVGSGAGGMIKALRRYRPHLRTSGCDISRAAILSASDERSGVRFDVADVYSLPYRDSEFNAVVMFDVLEHLENPEKALIEVSRVVASGGLFHLYVPCEGEWHTVHGVLNLLGWRPKEQYGGHIQRFTAREVVSLLRHAGFEILRKRWSGHPIHQLVDASYFTALAIRGENVKTSVEGYLETARPGPLRSFIEAAKTLVAIASYLESAPLSWFPGLGIHATCRKRGNQAVMVDPLR